MQFNDQEEKKESEGFDLRVTHRDARTGLVTESNPYTMKVIMAPDGGKTRIFERPVGSGNYFDKKNNPIGRWIEGKLDRSAAHIEFKAPETKDQKLARALTAKDAEIEALRKELAAIEAQGKAKNKKEQGS